MKHANYTEAKNHLLSAAHQISPNNQIQGNFTKYLVAMEQANKGEEAEHFILQHLAHAIADGLAWGNWPAGGYDGQFTLPAA